MSRVTRCQADCRQPDDDPYLWLEDIEGTRALAWVEAENDRTLKTFGGAQFAADRDTLAAILDRPDKLPLVVRRGPWLYNFWLDAKNPRGLWRRTTLESFRLDQPAWEILLDIDALAAAEGKDWIWSGATTRPGTHDRAIVRLSRGGSDAVVLREFDLPSKAFVKDGFVLPEAKGWVSWLDPNTLLLNSAWGGDVTTSGYARTVRLWRRGSDAAQAPVLFEIPRESMSVGADVDLEHASKLVWYVEYVGFFDVNLWMATARAATGQARPADRHRDADPSRLDGDQATQGLDGGRQDLACRHLARHPAGRVHGRRPRFHRAVRAGRTTGAAGLLLERRPARAVDPRQPAAGVRGPHTVRRRLGAAER